MRLAPARTRPTAPVPLWLHVGCHPGGAMMDLPELTKRGHMSYTGNDWITDLAQRLKRLGEARNREIDREPRTITITDDEALLLMHLLETAERIVTGAHDASLDHADALNPNPADQ